MEASTWYALIVTAAALNMIGMVYFWIKTKDHPNTSFNKWVRLLAVPWIFECAYRSVFPSLYLQRYTYWDTPFNSIIVDRNFACVGELAWTAQFALIMCQLDKDLFAATHGGQSGSTKWIQFSGYLAVAIYVVAEGMSYYNVSTTNEWWCAVSLSPLSVFGRMMAACCFSQSLSIAHVPANLCKCILI